MDPVGIVELAFIRAVAVKIEAARNVVEGQRGVRQIQKRFPQKPANPGRGFGG